LTPLQKIGDVYEESLQFMTVSGRIRCMNYEIAEFLGGTLKKAGRI